MGFFSKVFGKKKKKEDEEDAVEEQEAAESESEPEPEPEPEPKVVVEAAPEPEPEPKVVVEAAPEPEPEPKVEVAEDDKAPEPASDDRGVPDQASGSVFTPSSGARPRFSSGSLRSVSNSVECDGCHRELPVPLPGHAASVTCPFCLTRNAYQPG